ncbi:MAG: LysR family transcriptional regulator [Clostridia bacterium]|nr:LysR family transcriptional regulator [Clostridia bacterium]MBP3649683.1 LysR family transcriptional regulator [Clostridia bacterium]
MNITHMKYAYEVAKVGSLSKAAEKLFVAVPNLSRSIKELEADLGITIFDRSVKGMRLTPDGEEFVQYARRILRQIGEMEQLYKGTLQKKQQFSISVPRASYIAEAFAEFSKSLTDDDAELFYKETNSQRTIKNILEHDYKLGILRYAAPYDVYFKTMLQEKNLSHELVTEFTYRLVISRQHPLAQQERVTFDDLRPYIEVAHADPYVPSLPLSKVVKEELPENVNRRIFVFERASQFELLSRNTETFMWMSPLPQDLLDRYQLMEKICAENTRVYRDILVYRSNYHLTELDRQFIAALSETKQKYLSCCTADSL